MAYFAEINESNVVQRVIAVNDAECRDQYGNENEVIGALWCHNLLGGTWLQTSFNARIRGKFAGIGYRYDAVRDAFIAPQPYLSWVFNEITLDWDPPIPYPTDGKAYAWDESIQQWVEIAPPS